METVTAEDRGKKGLIPKLVAGLDIRRLPIGPGEAFILSRIDGKATDAEIAVATGLNLGEVVLALHLLADLGAVDYDDISRKKALFDPTKSRASDPVSDALASGRPRAEPLISPAPQAPPKRRRISFDPRELDEPAELDPERKRLILETFHRLDDATYYELLDVAPRAEKKAIKKAYYDVVAVFHPDKYFGKNLGSFRPKLERIFQHVTRAHDALTHPGNRADYDGYLESRNATRAFDSVADEEEAAREAEEIQREIEREAALAAGAEHATPSVTPAPFVSPSGIPARPLTPEERRRALARKLSGAGPSHAPAAAGSAPDAGPTTRAAAADELRRRYESRLAAARAERIRAYVQQADAALAAKNLIGAVNSLRLATSLAPADVELAARFRAVEQEASAALSGQYLEQARYDERRGHFVEAAAAYQRVLRGRPTAETYERTAHCLLEAHSDPKKAAELARKAVELGGGQVAYRITLARAYGAAGMEQSALAELERARTLAPSDDTIKDWIKRIKRGAS